MTCEFKPAECTIFCKKYPMCAYNDIQKTLLSIQEQLKIIYSHIKTSDALNKKNNAKIENDINGILDLLAESDMNKEYYEKINIPDDQ